MPTLVTFVDIINRVLPEPHAGLLSGILFGIKASISTDLYDALVVTGTLHIAALSGMNITILTKLFFSAFNFLLPRRISSILTMGVLLGFVLFVGPSASIIRAAIMGCITIFAVLFGRMSLALLTWTITVIVMLCVHFQWIGEVSFQLSVLASLGMIVFGQTKKDKTITSFIKNELTTTLSAQVFTIPLILFTFGRISLISPLTNLLIGWTIQIITVLGLFLCVLGFIWLPIGQIIAWFTWIFLEWLIQAVIITSKIPLASIGK